MLKRIQKMKRRFYLPLTACVLLGLGSCGGHTQQDCRNLEEYEKPDTTNAVQEMKDYHYSAEVRAGDVRYAYDIVREVNDSLPLVTGDEGARYADNYIRLRVNREGRQIFNHVFVKESFKDFLDRNFMKHAILEGMAFDRVDGSSLRFAASVCYPESDIYIPLTITLSPDGSYRITKDEILDTAATLDSADVEE